MRTRCETWPSLLRTNRQRSTAFTLMEVMLALAVSAIVLAAIGGVFYSAIRLRERTAAMLDESIPLHQAFGFIRRDLQGAMPPGGLNVLAGDFKTELVSGGIGQNCRLQFFSTTGVLSENSTMGDLQEVVYELRDSTDRTKAGKDLVRSVSRNLLSTGTQEPDDQYLMSHVESLEFACYDGSNWRESWDTSLSDTNLPSAVRVRIQLAGDNPDNGSRQPFELIVPLVCQSRTNALQTASNGGTQ
jgi:type II secretion system protein J